MEGAPSEPPIRRIERRLGAEALKPEIRLMPWADEVVETLGFGPRSMYVETCWLPVLGPTATWAYRRLGSWAEFNPEGVNVDLIDFSVSLGLGEGLGRHSLIGRALDRLARYDAVRWNGEELQVRRALAPLPERLAKHLPYSSRRLHEEYTRRPARRIGGQS